MEKPNRKTKQAENPTFFKHFSPSFLTTKPPYGFCFHFFSTQVSCTSWHSNTKETLGHKEHKLFYFRTWSFPSATLTVPLSHHSLKLRFQALSANEHLFILNKTIISLLNPHYTSHWPQEEAKASVLMCWHLPATGGWAHTCKGTQALPFITENLAQNKN